MGTFIYSFIGILILVIGVNALLPKEKKTEVSKEIRPIELKTISVYIKQDHNMFYCFDISKDLKQDSLVIDSENKLYKSCMDTFGTNEFVFDKTALYAVENDFKEVLIYKTI